MGTEKILRREGRDEEKKVNPPRSLEKIWILERRKGKKGTRVQRLKVAASLRHNDLMIILYRNSWKSNRHGKTKNVGKTMICLI